MARDEKLAMLAPVKRLFVLGAVVIGLALAWRFSPIPPDELLHRAQELRDVPLAALWVPAAYVVLGLVMFPFMALRLGTVLVFGPILGPLYSILGATLSALVGYHIGRRVGAEAIERSIGPRAEALRQRLARRGVLSVAAARMVPFGPFSLVNAFAGAARIPRRDFLLGTFLGTLPGLVVLALASAPLARLL